MDEIGQRAAPPTADLAALSVAEMPDHAEEFWEHEFRQRLLSRALELIKRDFQETTWQAAMEVIVASKTPAEVAGSLRLERRRRSCRSFPCGGPPASGAGRHARRIEVVGSDNVVFRSASPPSQALPGTELPELLCLSLVTHDRSTSLSRQPSMHKREAEPLGQFRPRQSLGRKRLFFTRFSFFV